jgi:predicted regulator of Ras-like GTPase activity (Roadblock/LC7/MglB family)
VPFKTILRNLVEEIPHASGAVLADWEGESVEHFCLYDDYELKLLGAHKGIILNRMKEIQAGLTCGELQHAVITTGKLTVIVAVVGPDYALVLTLEREAMIGLALYRLRQAIKLLAKEIY